MPDLNSLPIPLHNADQPYHWEYDNLPLKVLEQRDDLINGEVDTHSEILRQSSGTQGTLANRLAQSLDEDGNLVPESINQASHNIAEHSDGSKLVSNEELDDYIALGFPSLENPVDFVRMLQSERAKLASIADDATNLTIGVETISNIVFFEEGEMELAASESISWIVEAPNKVKPVLTVSTEFAHRHFYDLEPVTILNDDPSPILYKLFKVTSVATPFIEDSLRVYVNGIRLNPTASVYHPTSNPNANWVLNSFVADAENGLFTLDLQITEDDVIKIDFDEALT